jgi:hypothetical protein
MQDKDIEGKIDDLAQMVAEGFKELRQELKGDINELRDEMVTKTDRTSRRDGDQGRFASFARRHRHHARPAHRHLLQGLR